MMGVSPMVGLDPMVGCFPRVKGFGPKLGLCPPSYDTKVVLT